MKLSTGYIIAGAYATKLRKTLFAQLRDKIKAGEMDTSEIARAAGELNRILFELFVNKLGLDKGDVVRVRAEYNVEDGKIVWNLSSLEVEVFRRLPEADIREALDEILQEGASFSYSTRRLGSTPLGDEVYAILENGQEVGILVATRDEDEVIIRGALRNPPRIIEKTKLPLQESVERTVAANIEALSQRAKPAEENVVEKVIKEIEDLVKG